MRKKRRTSFVTNCILCLLTAAIVVPVLLMLVWVFTERWAWPDLTPQVFSGRAVMEILLRKRELAAVFASSILISTAVAALSVVVALMTARALVFYEFRGRRLMYFFTVLPFMVPATVFAMGVQVTFIKLGLNNTAAGVIVAHLICSLPYAVRLLMDGMQAVGGRLEEQARVLGASRRQAFLRTTLPMLVPVILSAASMAYIVSFSQYFLTLLIGGGNVRTFTIIMVPYLQSGNRNIACIYSTVFFGVTLVVFAVFEGIAKRWTKNNSGGYYES